MMKRVLMVFCSVIASVAHAEQYTQTNVTLERVGSHAGNVFYVQLDSYKTNCAWGGLYCPESKEHCKNLYPMALAARASERPLKEIRYTQADSGEVCHIDLIAF